MMTKLFISIAILTLALLSVTIVMAQPGAIWTTRDDCGNESQDVNQYSAGEKVFINGKNFGAGNHSWSIEGQPGGASCDAGIVVASGIQAVNSTGNFCFEAYTVLEDDCGVYKADFNGKKDNYNVDNVPLVPEFGLIAGSVAILGAVAVFFINRRKKTGRFIRVNFNN